MGRSTHDLAVAAAAAAAFSGAPSTTWTIATRGDLLESTRAAATLLPGHRGHPTIAAGAAVHLGMSVVWTLVVSRVIPRRGAKVGAALGALAGVAIAVLDIGVIAERHFPAVAALPRAPQYADHIAFGMIAGAILGRDC
jgi:drug/metabolite transporter superfamily protein YnfA